MKRTTRLLNVAAIAAAMVAAPAWGQDRGPEPRPGFMRGAPMEGMQLIERILLREAELGLTTDQVSRLEEIQQRVEEQNAPLVEQLRAAAPTPEERAAARERRENGGGMPGARRPQLPAELAAVADQIRANRAAAFQEVVQVLTPEQLAQVRPRGMRRADAPRTRGSDRPGRMRMRAPSPGAPAGPGV